MSNSSYAAAGVLPRAVIGTASDVADASQAQPGGRAQGPRFVSGYTGSRVGFGRLLRSEWLKMWTLRSTWWVVGATIVLMVGLAVMLAVVMRVTLSNPEMMAFLTDPAEPGGAAGATGEGALGVFGALSGVTLITLGVQLAQLTVAVLAVLSITNEFGSGMIRATFAAAPRRGAVLLAKLVVAMATTAALAVLGLGLSWLATWPVMLGVDQFPAASLANPTDARALGGAVLYLMAIAMLALGVGALIRSTAGAIATVLGLLLVVPEIMQLVAMLSTATWPQTVNRYLPSVAGSQVYSTFDMGAAAGLAPALSPWAGFAVLLAYAVIVFAAATLAVRRRDA